MPGKLYEPPPCRILAKDGSFLGEQVLPPILAHGQLFLTKQDGERDERGRLPVRGLASTPDLDLQGDIVLPTAFAETISTGTFAERPIMLAYHRMDRPVGLWPERNVTEAGLEVEGFISSAAPDIQQLVIDGVLGGLSIGWIPKETIVDEELEAFIRTKVDLFEISLVPLPANLATFAEVAKSWSRESYERYKRLPREDVYGLGETDESPQEDEEVPDESGRQVLEKAAALSELSSAATALAVATKATAEVAALLD